MKIEETLNREIYNSFIDSASFAHGFQLWEYGEAKRFQGWKPKRFFILDKTKLIGIFQILTKKVCNFKVGIAPFAPVFIIENSNNKKEFVKLIPKLVERERERERLLILLIHPYFDNSLNLLFSVFPSLKQGIAYNSTYIIDLRKELGEIFKKFSPTTRNEIRRSLKEDKLKIEYGNEENLYRRFHNLLVESVKRSKGTCLSFDFFKKLGEETKNNKHSIAFIASYQGKDVSGILLLCCGRTIIYQWAGMSKQLMKLFAQRRLIYEVIKWGKSEGYYFFDLGGITLNAPEKSKKYGIQFFKSSFGGELKEIPGSFVLTKNKLLSILLISLYRFYRNIYEHIKQ